PEVVEDALLGLLRRALGVGVLDAENVGAVMAAREQPVEQRRARVPDVQGPGRARRKTNPHFLSLIRGASPLGLPYTVARAPLRRRAPLRWLASLRSLALSRRIASLRSLALSRSIVRAHRHCRLLTSATAWAAIASPRPTASTPSLVLPLMLTRDASTSSAFARRARISST